MRLGSGGGLVCGNEKGMNAREYRYGWGSLYIRMALKGVFGSCLHRERCLAYCPLTTQDGGPFQKGRALHGVLFAGFVGCLCLVS